MSYLAEFLFPPYTVRGRVKTLSGGERNRLLLARLFTQPANLLVLDEPTNDLDVDTLELLEGLLVEYDGTLLLASHDRAFLDGVVTSIYAFEGNGRVREYVGGYSDWRQASQPRSTPSPRRRPPLVKKARQGLTYLEQRELDTFPSASKPWKRSRRGCMRGWKTLTCSAVILLRFRRLWSVLPLWRQSYRRPMRAGRSWNSASSCTRHPYRNSRSEESKRYEQ